MDDNSATLREDIWAYQACGENSKYPSFKPVTGSAKVLQKIATLLSLCFGLWAYGPIASADVLRVGATALPSAQFNPWASPNQPGAFILSAVFDGLTRLGPDGAPQPWLSTSWSSKDAKVWQFSLRKNVRFSSGREFTARDVVLALRYLTGPTTMREVSAQDFAHVRNVRASSEHEIEIQLSHPDVLFPRTVSQLLIPDSSTWNEIGPERFAQSPVGTGPFSVENLSDEKVILSGFSTSWRAPSESGIEFMFIEEPSTRLNGLLSRRLDIAFAVSLDDKELIEQADGTLYYARLPSVLGLILVSTRPDSPLHIREVRQALNYAVDVDSIASAVTGTNSGVATQPTARSAFGYHPDLVAYGYDPERARALLSQAGYETGFNIVAEVSLSSPSDALVFQKIADDLSRVGVGLTLHAIPYPTFVSQFRTGEWKGDAFNLMFSTEPNLDALRGIKYHSCAWPAQWFCDPAITPRIEAASVEPDIQKRIEMSQDIMAYYLDQAPAIFLYEYTYFFGLSEAVSNFSVVNSFIPWHEVSLSN